MGYTCPYSLREIQAVENASAEAGFNIVTAAILEETARILGARHFLEDDPYAKSCQSRSADECLVLVPGEQLTTQCRVHKAIFARVTPCPEHGAVCAGARKGSKKNAPRERIHSRSESLAQPSL